MLQFVVWSVFMTGGVFSALHNIIVPARCSVYEILSPPSYRSFASARSPVSQGETGWCISHGLERDNMCRWSNCCEYDKSWGYVDVKI